MHIAIIGAGLAGLVAAATAARGGATVTLLDGAGQIGGRARSQSRDGFTFNMGPHALYLRAGGAGVLDHLGVARHGAPPVLNRALADLNGALQALPTTPAGLLRSPILSARGKVQVARGFSRWGRAGYARSQAGMSWDDWLAVHASDPTARRLITALGRLASYSARTDISAEIPLSQLRLASGGVEYVHGGWQTLVDCLTRAAEQHGATVLRDRAARELRIADHGWTITTDDRTIHADGVIVATPPKTAAALLGSVAPAATTARINDVRPVTAAALTLGLTRLPRPRMTFALGLDEPTYLSVHSAAARLAPEGGAVVHLARYLGPEDDGRTARPALESLMDRVQPGWRDVLVVDQFLPNITIVGDTPTAGAGGLSGRVDVSVAPGLALAGDWVGDRAWLADAAILSGRAAARQVLADGRGELPTGPSSAGGHPLAPSRLGVGS